MTYPIPDNKDFNKISTGYIYDSNKSLLHKEYPITVGINMLIDTTTLSGDTDPFIDSKFTYPYNISYIGVIDNYILGLANYPSLNQFDTEILTSSGLYSRTEFKSRNPIAIAGYIKNNTYIPYNIARIPICSLEEFTNDSLIKSSNIPKIIENNKNKKYITIGPFTVVNLSVFNYNETYTKQVRELLNTYTEITKETAGNNDIGNILRNNSSTDTITIYNNVLKKGVKTEWNDENKTSTLFAEYTGESIKFYPDIPIINHHLSIMKPYVVQLVPVYMKTDNDVTNLYIRTDDILLSSFKGFYNTVPCEFRAVVADENKPVRLYNPDGSITDNLNYIEAYATNNSQYINEINIGYGISLKPVEIEIENSKNIKKSIIDSICYDLSDKKLNNNDTTDSGNIEDNISNNNSISIKQIITIVALLIVIIVFISLIIYFVRTTKKKKSYYSINV